jgi:hypothetical protein
MTPAFPSSTAPPAPSLVPPSPSVWITLLLRRPSPSLSLSNPKPVRSCLLPLAAWLVGSADHVFDGAATNERIYGTVVRELVGAIGGGFNGTAFTYGQTSCGKTFTMNGSDADPGIIRRAVRDVFDTVRQVC